ncbi:phage tail tape measure protein, family [gut metagenome]|uniref:Phage tail tape measure protein, family n=1 Tax=gut metagenome TaxID=749906 RepID=J9G9G9_9ZZZZ
MLERVTDGMTDAIDKSLSFGQSIADLSSITGITGKELEQLETNARKFGEASGLGANTASRAYSILASQIQVADIGMNGLNNLLNKSITLAHASDMSMDASAEALAATINQFGLGAEQADRVINVLAAGSKYGAAEISELSQSFKVVGASANAMGLNVEETAGALEVLSKANLKGSEAGTALRNIILKLNTELGIDLGETSLEAALVALQPKITDATYLSKVFGMENLAAAQFLIQNANAVGQMTAQLTGTNVAQEQAATRTATNS